MVCPDCDTPIPTIGKKKNGTPLYQLGPLTCIQCNTHLAISEKGLRVVHATSPSTPDRGEPTLTRGTLGYRDKVRQSHPLQLPYEIDGNVVMDCVCCHTPTPYYSLVRGKWWDGESTIPITKTDTQFVVNRTTTDVTPVQVHKTIMVPTWIHGSLCEACVGDSHIQVKVVKSDYDVKPSSSPDLDRRFPRSRNSKANVRCKPHKPHYVSRG